MTSLALLTAVLLAQMPQPPLPTPAPALPVPPAGIPGVPGLPGVGPMAPTPTPDPAPTPPPDPTPPPPMVPTDPTGTGNQTSPGVSPQPIRVLLLDLVTGDGMAAVDGRSIVAGHLSELTFIRLFQPGDPDVAAAVAGALQATGPRDDAAFLASVGSAAKVDKVVGGSIKFTGGKPSASLMLVDAGTAQPEWKQTNVVEGTETGKVLHEQAGLLGRHLWAFYGPPTLRPPGQAPDLNAVAPPQAPSAEPSGTQGFLTPRRGVGLALLGAGVALLPAAGLSLLVAGAGHLGGNQLAFVAPGADKPRYYSTVFTWTWGDVLVAGALALISLGLVGVGGIVTVIP